MTAVTDNTIIFAQGNFTGDVKVLETIDGSTLSAIPSQILNELARHHHTSRDVDYARRHWSESPASSSYQKLNSIQGRSASIRSIDRPEILLPATRFDIGHKLQVIIVQPRCLAVDGVDEFAVVCPAQASLPKCNGKKDYTAQGWYIWRPELYRTGEWPPTKARDCRIFRVAGSKSPRVKASEAPAQSTFRSTVDEETEDSDIGEGAGVQHGNVHQAAETTTQNQPEKRRRRTTAFFVNENPPDSNPKPVKRARSDQYDTGDGKTSDNSDGLRETNAQSPNSRLQSNFVQHPFGRESKPVSRPLTPDTTTPSELASPLNHNELDYNRVTVFFKDATNQPAGKIIALATCLTAADLFEEDIANDIASKETRMLEIEVKGITRKARKDNEEHFQDKLLGPVRDVLRDQAEPVVVTVKPYL